MTRFREHRGDLDESMKTLVELETFDELVTHIQAGLKPWGVDVKREDISVEHYCDYPDTRIGWQNTFIVIVKDYGPMGFTDSLPVGCP